MSVKISDLTAKGSAIASTDLVEIAEVSGGGYVSKKVTGANILANVVPYTGATTDVDLGNNDLNAEGIKIKGTAGNGHLNLKHQSSASTAGGSESVFYADNSGNPKWKNDGNAVQNVMLENSAITGATKTKITYDSKGLVTSGADATTADIADSSNKRYVTDAQLTVIGNTSGTNTGDQTLTGLGGVPTTRIITTTSPLSGGGDLSADRTLSIADAVADGSTKGAASFTASDFNSTSGNISIDYTNGQAASSSNKGFLTSTDWSTFNGKANKASANSGIDISFRTPEVYNTRSSAGTGNITGDYTNAIIGVVQKVYHNDSVAPTVPATWIKLGTGTYTPSTLNIIYVEWTSSNIAEYWIVKGS